MQAIPLRCLAYTTSFGLMAADILTNVSIQTLATAGELQHRVVRGALAYSGRQLAVNGLNIITGLVLTRILFPADFGYVAIASVFVGLSLIVSEGGLGAYFIQRDAEITHTDISRMISLQMVFFVVLQTSLTFVTFGAWLFNRMSMLWLVLWVSGFSLPFGLLRSGSLILLERSLKFRRIAVVETVEQLAFTATSVTLAVQGFGVWSILLAWVVRPVLGWQLARYYAPWTWTIYYRPQVAGLGKGLRFGLTYQLPALLETVRAAINPLFVGSLLGVASVGYIDRAILIASMPISVFAVVWRKILFPYFARIQADLSLVRNVFKESVYLHSVLDKAAYLPLVTFCPELIEIVLGSKWLPIVPLVYILVSGNVLFVAFSTTSTALLAGIGSPGVLAQWSIIQVGAAWVLAFALVTRYGIVGYALVSVFLWGGAIYMGVHVRRLIGKLEVIGSLFRTILAFSVSFVAVRLIANRLEGDSFSLVTIGSLSALGLVFYFLVLFLIDGGHLRMSILRVVRSFAASSTN